MYKSLIVYFLLIFFTACNMDNIRQKQFAGTYEVTLSSPKIKQELSGAQKEVQQEMAKAKEEINKSMEEAQKEMAENLGTEGKIGEAVSKFVEGMGKLAEGMTDLGEALGNMGIELGEKVFDGMKFEAVFHQNGDAFFGKNNNGKVMRWEIKDDQLYLWEKADEAEKQAFTIHKLDGKNCELKSDDVVFHLTHKAE